MAWIGVSTTEYDAGFRADGGTVRDERSLEAFLASVERRAFRIAEMATRERDEAVDIVQDAMMQLARSYGDRQPTEWPPLFHRILENKIHDWQRRQGVRRRLFFRPAAESDTEEEREDPLAAVPDPRSGDISEELKREQAMEQLSKSLQALPARQRQAFVLRIWEGLNVEDTAKAMGCSDGSVKTHLSRALAVLRRDLAGVWP
jgi:RNA polymerase sigma-70 factor (ECF subfamily)